MIINASYRETCLHVLKRVLTSAPAKNTIGSSINQRPIFGGCMLLGNVLSFNHVLMEYCPG